MELFTKDEKVIREIANSLQECGCCARCTLRYLGLKETYAYKKCLQEMKDEVDKLLKGGNADICTANETEKTDSNKTCKKAPDIINGDTGSEIDSTDPNLGNDDTLGKANVYSEVNVIVCKSKTNTVEKTNLDHTVSTESAEGKTVSKASDEIRASISKSNVREPVIDNQNLGEEDTIEPNTENGGQEETKSKSACVIPEQMDTGEPMDNGLQLSKEKVVADKKELISTEQREKPCVVCLGILEEFTSDEFLQKIKVASVDEGFEFTNYICSLMIPVSIILREHALMLYLKETYGSVYENVKFLDIPTIKDVWKWRNGPLLREILGAPFDQKSSFDIVLNFVYKDSDRECSFLLSLMSDTFRKRKQDRRNNKKGAFQVYNRANVTKAVLEMSTKEFKSHFQCPPKVPSSCCTCDIKCQNEAIFIAGRYNKYSRILSQTPWFIEGQRKSESSVEELICTEIDRVFRPTEHKFSSAGREDVDVLMLGDGRPFIVELTNPRRVSFTQKEMTDIQTAANAATKDIRVQDLQIVSREETDKLKEGEIDKIKNYSALCWSKTPVSAEELHKLTEINDLKILQKTPIRVLHRRPLSTREKCIHAMTVEKVDDYHFRMGLKTQAGTYIKEFIHGDFGRTKPNLTALVGVDCDILELDVQSVELDWPKKLE